MFIHSTTTLPILGVEDKRSKDVEIGEKTLVCSDDSFDSLSFDSIVSIESSNHKDWFKITFNDDSELILDRSSEIMLEDLSFIKLEDIDVTQSLYNIEGRPLYVKNKKLFGRESLAYNIKTNKDYLFIDKIVVKN